MKFEFEENLNFLDECQLTDDIVHDVVSNSTSECVFYAALATVGVGIATSCYYQPLYTTVTLISVPLIIGLNIMGTMYDME